MLQLLSMLSISRSFSLGVKFAFNRNPFTFMHTCTYSIKTVFFLYSSHQTSHAHKAIFGLITSSP